MTTRTKTVPSLHTLPRAVRKFRWAVRLPLCAALVYGLLACPDALLTAAPAADSGTITGTVVNELSHPVRYAMVYAFTTGGSAATAIATAMALPWAETDAKGRFAIRRLRWGTYTVGAEKPGYAPVIGFENFYGRSQMPEVTVSPQTPTASVVVRIGPKAALLSGKIVSAQTGEPITHAGIDLRREGRPGAWVGESVPVQFTLAVPSEMALSLTVRAPGFEPWSWTGKMTPGERKALTIRLRPSAPGSGNP